MRPHPAILERPDAHATSLTDAVDLVRLGASRRLPAPRRAELGQFLTPSPIARFMASLFRATTPAPRVLDAGAGVGSLSAALVEELTARAARPERIALEAWEIDAGLVAPLRETLARCAALCAERGVALRSTVHVEDFVEAGVAMLEGGLFARRRAFDLAILNPPYRKLRSDSEARRRLQQIGLDASNLYAGFLAVAVELLAPGGELVAITPRSFCNGPYFRPFRERLLSSVAIARIHVFDRRDVAFRDDDVLQETVIVHVVKGATQGRVTISTSEAPDDPLPTIREVPFETVVRADDPDRVIHVVADDRGDAVRARLDAFDATLSDLEIEVSTGRVVDFRVRDHLVAEPSRDCVPLIYPVDLAAGAVRWPRSGSKKANAIRRSDATESLLLPRGTYVLTKRFTSKEETRRIVAAVYDPAALDAPRVGFENHLNVFHARSEGLPDDLARGLCAWLNSTLVDEHFRAWSGHTQVNATDLRAMRWPGREQLAALGRAIPTLPATQEALDREIARRLFTMTDQTIDPVAVKRRVQEALAILVALGLPKDQQNERSALTLLALLDLRPDDPWNAAAAPLRGITPMMDFFASVYGKRYAPNTRETVRRSTVHQFVDAGLVLENPDDPRRPTNSPRAVYQVAPPLLALVRAFGAASWAEGLAAWRAEVESLAARYARAREQTLLPVLVKPDAEIKLSPGGHSELIKQIVDAFCPRFTPGARVL